MDNENRFLNQERVLFALRISSFQFYLNPAKASLNFLTLAFLTSDANL